MVILLCDRGSHSLGDPQIHYADEDDLKLLPPSFKSWGHKLEPTKSHSVPVESDSYLSLISPRWNLSLGHLGKACAWFRKWQLCFIKFSLHSCQSPGEDRPEGRSQALHPLVS